LPKRNFKFKRGEFYHINNRGLSKKKIFYTKEDYEWFINQISIYKKKYNIDVICYCLMPNHFHLIIKQTGEADGSKFVSYLQASYSRHFNSKWNRKGQLFDGRYFPTHIKDQEQLINTINYIINNPVKAGLVKSAKDWPYLSFNLPKKHETLSRTSPSPIPLANPD